MSASDNVARPSVRVFGSAPDGDEVQQVTIANGPATASIITWGASLQDLRLFSIPHSLVLGAPTLEPYFDTMRYFGAIVGPLANRVAGGRMNVGGRNCDLDRNENETTTLHGGTRGFGCRNWTLMDLTENGCTLSLRHPDGLCGFPGNILIEAHYELEETGALRLEIAGRTDAPTFFGPAFHGYWNLDGGRDLSHHRLTIPADSYLPVDHALIPAAAPASVAGTAFDFRQPRRPDGNLDHNFCLSTERSAQPRLVCQLETDRMRLALESTEVGLQVYDAGRLDTAPDRGHSGGSYGRNEGIAIEPQFWPDTPNRPGFPPSLLRPGEEYRQVSRFFVHAATCPKP